jgi:HAD superfamily hydrolase (TIGR01459 family)
MVGQFVDLVDSYDAFLLDAYGVFWGSNEVGMLPGAAEAMAMLVASGKQVGILSNATQLADAEKLKLAKHGVVKGVHYHFLITSGQILRNCLLQNSLPFPTPTKSYWLFGTPHPHFRSQLDLFEGTSYRRVEDIEDADFIYLAIPHIGGVDQEDPELFRAAVAGVEKKLPVVCANPDAFAHMGKPAKVVVRQGSIARMFEERGFSICWIGKPAAIAYICALNGFSGSLRPEEILMIGDTPETDIRGAVRAGLGSALVVYTGIMAERGETWDQLPETDQPEFLIERFAID